MDNYKKVIAIDFDGCICTSAWPEIGEPNWGVINRAKAEKDAGAELILWTCREGELLEAALKACYAWGLTFDAVNDNTPRMVELYGNNPRKVSAAEYWDDHAVTMPGLPGEQEHFADAGKMSEEICKECSLDDLWDKIAENTNKANGYDVP